MPCLARLLLAVLAIAVSVPSTAAAGDERHAPASDEELAGLLGDLWTTIFATPAVDNALAGGDPCVRLGDRVVAPFGPSGTTELTCTVHEGTKIFVAAWTSECSDAEPPPFFGAGEAALRDCARAADAEIDTPTVTLDGAPVAVAEVVTDRLDVTLPADNVLGAPAGTAVQSVAHGWVALLRCLPVGTHTIELAVTGTDVFGNPVDLKNKTTIVVTPAHEDDDDGDDDDDDGGDEDDD